MKRERHFFLNRKDEVVNTVSFFCNKKFPERLKFFDNKKKFKPNL